MASAPTLKTISLNSAEELFTELRDLNYHAVGPLLNRRARHVKEAFEVFLFPIHVVSSQQWYCGLLLNVSLSSCVILMLLLVFDWRRSVMMLKQLVKLSSL